ncbi:MAG: hypothetical protein SWO11_04675 [Thermodesulfobacteriota bacterium]|nr:hypothetical protein [Thermodesulfobacteriota bacterium]
MKCRIAITIPLSLIVLLYLASSGFATSSADESKKDEKATEDQLKIGASPPMRGTVAFNALNGSRDIPGVKIRIDGEEKGVTDENGELLVKWLVAGKHKWSAFYEEEEVSQGKFEVSKIIEAKIIDRKAIFGKEFKEPIRFYALKDSWTFVHTVKNTGTTVIDHYALELSSSSGKGSAVKIKLISPPLPGWVWKPFAGHLKTGRRMMEVIIKDHGVEMADQCSHHPMGNLILYNPISKGGLWPGETITISSEEHYTKTLEEFYQCMAVKLDTKITNEIVDADNGIMNLFVKKYKISFLTFNDIKIKLTFKGLNRLETCFLRLYIDDKLCDTAPWFEFFWL